MRRRWFVLILAAALAALSTARAGAEPPLVIKLTLTDTIQPVSEGLLKRALTQANRDGAEIFLLELNTPGGLLESTRAMVGEILQSPVPVVVYIAPPGARAGSAGFFLLEAADVAAMAPGANAGAAHPVSMLGGDPGPTMKEKVENDAAAFLRSYVVPRGRNALAAEAAVRTSSSYSAAEARELGLVDLLASDEPQLLAALDGREVRRLDGIRRTLHLTGARVAAIEPTLREDLLGWLVNPNIAVLFLAAGVLLVYLEFNTPGAVAPGALGTLMILLAVFGLNLLPVRFTSVLLLLAALILFALEAKFGGYGVLAVAGLACLLFGLLTLVAAPIPELSILPAVAIAFAVAFGGITVFLLRLAVRAKRQKVRLGAAALVGFPATAMEPISPEGHVLVEGEIWLATSDQPIAQGASVRVVAAQELRLHVAPLTDGAPLEK